MSIIETLGETTVICSDKTGTITKGEMTVRKIFADNHFYEVTGSGYETKGHFMRDRKRVSPAEDPTLDLLIMDAVLCNDAIIKREKKNMEYKTIGSPTESALLFMGAKADRFREDMRWVRKEELPFSSERKRMSVLCEADGEKRVFAKGAPEYILEKCRFIQRQNRLMKLTERERKRILESNRVMTLASLRTMAFATKKVGALAKDHFEEGLVFLGLVGMEDPPREEVREAIRICHEAGIKVKMITGDNRETTLAIAKEIGLHGKIMEGGELDEITDGELKKAIGSIDLFARVKPEHKLRIVNALKANGEIVTMTGDGVNDAPALKEAHIGIAMGKNGTDVSRSVADLTLKDDNFKTIVSAIREGRTIFKNIRKFASYQLSCTFAELGILLFGVILSPVLGWQVPLLLALHILFMNLVTADLPAIGLGLNPSSSDTMLDPPRRNSEILGKKLIILILATGSTLMLLVLSSYYISFNLLGETHESARTVALFTLIGLEITGAFGFRSFRKGILGRGLLVNPYIFYASVISLILTLVIVYTPANRVFETVPLGLRSLGIVGGVSLLFVLASDALKYMNKKWKWVDMEHV
jgi:Ca2+-transporting ATPase